MKKIKKEFIRVISQRYANFIIQHLNNHCMDDDLVSKDQFNFWMNQGIKLDSYCVNQDIYLK